MQPARDVQSARDTDPARNAEQSFGRVEVVILAGVNDIESGRPKSYGGGEPQDARIERAAHGNPSGGRRDAQAETQHNVRKGSEALGEGVKENCRQSERRQTQTEWIQRAGSNEKENRGS